MGSATRQGRFLAALRYEEHLLSVEGLLDSDSPDAEKNLTKYIAAEIRRQLLVRVQVEIVEYGALPRTDRKSKRIFDRRTED